MRSPLQETEESRPATAEREERFSTSGDVSSRRLTSSSARSWMELPLLIKVETVAKASQGSSHNGSKKERFIENSA